MNLRHIGGLLFTVYLKQICFPHAGSHDVPCKSSSCIRSAKFAAWVAGTRTLRLRSSFKHSFGSRRYGTFTLLCLVVPPVLSRLEKMLGGMQWILVLCSTAYAAMAGA